MKKYIQPAIETDDVLTLEGMMQLTVSGEEDPIGGGSGAGDAKSRDQEHQPKDGWEEGLW